MDLREKIYKNESFSVLGIQIIHCVRAEFYLMSCTSFVDIFILFKIKINGKNI